MDSQWKNKGKGVGAHFKTFDLIKVKEEDINKDYKVEKSNVRKVKKLKTFHCFAAIGPTELIFRISKCSCQKCQQGDYSECGNEKVNGKRIKHCIFTIKKNYNHSKSEEDSSEDEEDINVDSDEDEMDEEFLQKNDEDETTLQNTVALGPTIKEYDFIVVTIENKQYVAKVWHLEDVKATSKFMRPDFSNEDSRVMKFRYPWVDDI